MKNKKTVFLLICVVIIWGYIAFQIVSRLISAPHAVGQPIRSISARPPKPKMYPLTLTYADPFLKTAKPKVVLRPAINASTKRDHKVVGVVNINWNKVSYFGMMQNGSRNKVIGNLKIDQTDHLVQRGQTVEGFTVTEILKDSVQLIFQNQKKFIKRQVIHEK